MNFVIQGNYKNMQVKGIDFVLYNVSDYKKAVAFYQDILGLQLIDEYGGFWAEFQVGNAILALRAPHPGGTLDNRIGGCAVALAVYDVKAAVEELRGKAVSILADIEETEVCFMAEIADPDGNRIILHKRKVGTLG